MAGESTQQAQPAVGAFDPSAPFEPAPSTPGVSTAQAVPAQGAFDPSASFEPAPAAPSTPVASPDAPKMSPAEVSLWQRVKDMVTWGAPSGSFLAAHNTKVYQPGDEKKEMQLVSPEALMTAVEQDRHPMVTEVAKFGGALTTPTNVMLALGLGGAGKLPGLARPIVTGLTTLGFTAPVIKQAWTEIPEFKDAMLGQGKYADVPVEEREKAAKILITHTVLGAAMIAHMTQHAAYEAGNIGLSEAEVRARDLAKSQEEKPIADQAVRGVISDMALAAKAGVDAAVEGTRRVSEAVKNRKVPKLATPEEAAKSEADFRKAIPPGPGKSAYTPEDYQVARPYLEKHHATVEEVDDPEAVRDAMEHQRQAIENKVRPQIEKYGKDPLALTDDQGQPASVKQKLVEALKDQEAVRPGFTDDALKVLDEFNLTDPSLSEADKIREALNTDNRKKLQESHWNISDAVDSDPDFAARYELQAILRDGIYDQLENRGVKNSRLLRQHESSLIRVRNAADRMVPKAESTVRGTGEAGPVRRAGAWVARKAGIAGGAAAGAATEIPGGAEVGAVLGGMGGEKVASILAPGDLTREKLVQRSVGVKATPGQTPELDVTNAQSPTLPAEPIPPAPAAPAPPKTPLMPVGASSILTEGPVDHALHADLATYYGELIGATPLPELEQRFLTGLEEKAARNEPLKPTEKNLISKINQAKARVRAEADAQAQAAAEEQQKAAEKAAAEKQKADEKAKKEAEKAAKEVAKEVAEKEKERTSVEGAFNPEQPFEPASTEAPKPAGRTGLLGKIKAIGSHVAEATQPHLEVPADRLPEGHTQESAQHHELGHVFAAGGEGLAPTDIVSHNHPDLADTKSALGVGWQEKPYAFEPDAAKKYTSAQILENTRKWLTAYMGGGAANELLNGIPLEENNGLVSDLRQARNLLEKSGIKGDQGLDEMAAAYQRAKAHLTKPGVLDKIKANGEVREENLPDTHHYSAGRLERMLGEQNGEPTEGRETNAPQGVVREGIPARRAAVEGTPSAGGKEVAESEVAKSANEFNRLAGRPDINAAKVPHSPETAQRIAQEYEAMQHSPEDPAVKKAYEAAKKDIDDQWNYAQDKMGVKFEPWTKEGQPYANSKEMVTDVKNNKHLYFFQGGELPVDHPLAAIDPETGFSYNDKLRAVHDLFGHAAHEFQFGPKGEENAWNVHRQMFSPEAVPAITTETRGQNSWVNFGPHLRVPFQEGRAIPPERTTGSAANDASIKAGGGIPGGVMKGDPSIGLPELVMFHDPTTGSTLAVKAGEAVTPEAIKTKLQASRQAYLEAKPEDSRIPEKGQPGYIAPTERPYAQNKAGLLSKEFHAPERTALEAEEEQDPVEAVRNHAASPVSPEHWERMADRQARPDLEPEGLRGKTSAEANKVKGEWTPERIDLQDRAILAENGNKPSQAAPTAVIIGGPGGAGKSNIAKFVNLPDAVTIDADSFRDALPEYKLMKESDPLRAAARTQDEVRSMAGRAVDLASSKNQDIIWDNTSSNPNAIRDMIQNLKDNGYRVEMHFVDTPVENASDAAARRAESEGRWVPPHIADKAHTGAAQSYLQNKDLADTSHLWTRDQNFDFSKVHDKLENGREITHDQNEYEKYQQKSGLRRDTRQGSAQETGGARTSLEAPAAIPKDSLSQRLVDTFGTTSDPHEAGFILSDGRMVPLAGEHNTMMDTLYNKYGDISQADAERTAFINNEQAVRTRTRTGRGGNEVVFSVPKQGITLEQLRRIRQSVGKMRDGNVVMEVSEGEGPYTKKEFARVSDVDPMLREIGAHPEQGRTALEENERTMLVQRETIAPEVASKSGQVEIQKIESGKEPRETEPLWHGSPSGDLRGSKSGLHIGTKEAATEALESRIGIPVEGSWDGTREYGKTLLAGQKTLDKMSKSFGYFTQTGYNVYAPEEDYYPKGDTTYSDGSKIPLNVKPEIFPVKITGKMLNTPETPKEDFYANSRMRGQLTRGNAKTGYYYRNLSEDEGSISAVVPRASHIERTKLEGGESEDWARKIAGNLAKQPAGGINPSNPEAPSKRYGFEILPEARQALDQNPTAQDFQNFATQHAQEIASHPDIKLGWDTTGEKPELNIGASTNDLETAKRMAAKLDQRALWDNEKGEVVPVGGKGEQTEFPGYPLESRLAELTGEHNPAEEGFQFGANAEGTPDQQKGLISTRLPSGPKATEDPLTQDLAIGRDSIINAPGKSSGKTLSERVVDKIREMPGVKIPENIKDPAKVMDRFVNHVADNLQSIYDQVPPERREANAKWYESANKLASDLGDKFGKTTKQAAAVIASLSPQKDWDMNVSLAQRLFDIYHTKADVKMTPEMESKASQLTEPEDVENPDETASKNQSLAIVMQNIRGKSLNELTDPIEKAAWIRLYDEAHNPRSYQRIDPATGTEAGTVMSDNGPVKAAWQTLNAMGNAVSVLEDGSRQNISDHLGGSHKVRNFYNNILDPNNPAGHVTVDTHAVAAGLMRPLGGKSTEVLDNFGRLSSKATGVKGMYPLYADAYRQAAVKIGIQPRQLQSIVWEEIRNMFPQELKIAKEKGATVGTHVQAVDDMWRAYEEGKNSLDKTRQDVRDYAQKVRERFAQNRGQSKVSVQELLEALGQGAMFALRGNK